MDDKQGDAKTHVFEGLIIGDVHTLFTAYAHTAGFFQYKGQLNYDQNNLSILSVESVKFTVIWQNGMGFIML